MKSWLSLRNIHPSPPNVSTSAANSVTPPRRCSPSTTTSSPNLRFSSFMLNLRSSITHSSSYPNTSSAGRCRATSTGPPSPPQTEPPNNEENSSSSPGIMASFSKAQDTMRICFAVLFWMSLFFWYSVWDGKNDGRPNKGSRFRR